MIFEKKLTNPDEGLLFPHLKTEKFNLVKKQNHPLKKLVICLMSRVFTNFPGDRGSIQGRVIPKTQKMVLDAALLSPQHF